MKGKRPRVVLYDGTRCIGCHALIAGPNNRARAPCSSRDAHRYAELCYNCRKYVVGIDLRERKGQSIMQAFTIGLVHLASQVRNRVVQPMAECNWGIWGQLQRDSEGAFKMGKGPAGKTPGIKRVGPYTWEEYLERVRSFHSYPAPGVLVGGIMVDMAMEKIPKGVLFNAICETVSCLPDSVQILTPCTVGNGWLRVINLGRYAVSLYDKYEGNGVRVYLDPKKLEGWDEIRAWILKLKTKREQDSDLLQEQIRSAGRDIYTLHPVQVKPGELVRGSKGAVAICSTCGEAYPARDGAVCLGCQGQAPYEAPASGKG